MGIDNKIVEGGTMDFESALKEAGQLAVDVLSAIDNGCDVPRTCECGADKGIRGIMRRDPLGLEQLVRHQSELTLGKDATPLVIGMTLGLIAATDEPEPCDEGCICSNEWSW